ncbi:MAG TPA: Crp/Fnr family transcriptional regulator [Chryseolinea sp.]|nr:Crp/Fnr family transcriptional regulator [Chryseolinea sp.]HPM32907.1 Crp/Fnr family transcriptional regulator [Chryseolinea sp.]
MFDPLLAHLRKYISLNEAEEKILLSYLHHQSVKKKEHLLVEGNVCSANHFILKGCFRMYNNTDQGTEQIVQFAIDNWWITDYNSLDMQKPSIFNIQAVENSEIAIIRKDVQEELFMKLPQLERYFRIILQRSFAASIMRIQYIFNQSGEERYKHFNSAFPDFVQRIPQYMLASYLGFTPEFLSKIRGKKD